MKYYNKKKKLRLGSWYQISVPLRYRSGLAKRWCQHQSSGDRFYFSPANETQWWFENKDDALCFMLAWDLP